MKILSRFKMKSNESKLFMALIIFSFILLMPYIIPLNVLNNNSAINNRQYGENKDGVNNDNNKEQIDTGDTYGDNSGDLSASDSSNPQPVEGGESYNNVSQFNVSEIVDYGSSRSSINIDQENLTFDVPTNWEAHALSLNISSVYKKNELFADYNRNGNFTNTMSPWGTLTNYPYSNGLSTEDPWFSNTYNPGKDRVFGEYHAGLGVVPGLYGYYNNNFTGINPNSYSVERGELYKGPEEEHPIWTDFLTDPNYRVVVDPYGDSKKDSQVYGTYSASDDALVNYIDVSSSLFGKGDPSVAFMTPFYVPFEADSILITLGWAVENLGYSYFDGFQVKARIDDHYIDGRIGAYGEDYSDIGSATSLEVDDQAGEASSHGVISRTYNITNLLGSYGHRAGWHVLDFGAYMEEPKTGDSDVKVYWDYIGINATHQRWNKAATVDFDFLLEDLVQTNYSVYQNMSMVLYLGTNEHVQYNMRYYIGETGSFSHSSDFDDDHIHMHIVLPQQYAGVLEGNNLNFYVGLEANDILYLNGYTQIDGFHQRFYLDTVQLHINYRIGSAESTNLQYKIDGEFDWKDASTINLDIIKRASPSFDVQFRIQTSSLYDRYIRYHAGVRTFKFSVNKAFASVYFDNYGSSNSTWNVTYNNTQSFNEFDRPLQYVHNRFYYYEFTIENLPALDGSGANSSDWDFYDIIAPNGESAVNITELNSTEPFHQNITVYNGTLGNPGNLTRGLWSALATQPNYMLNGSLYHLDYSQPERYYDGENSAYNLTVRNSTGILGNYYVNMKNYSANITSGFPKYYTNVNNMTDNWTVNDEGVGYYYLYSIWNDTDANNQTYRLGWYRDSFQLRRHTSGQVFEYPAGISIASGDIAIFNVQYNQTIDNTGINNATIECYKADSGLLWGEDWPPYEYLLDSLEYNGGGNYTIKLKTQGVPIGNYTVFFKMFKQFYDEYISLNVSLNITGALGIINLTYTYGAFNLTPQEVYLESWNIPYVNDTENCIIQVNLTDSVNSNPIRDAYIKGSINGSDIIITGIETYAYTHKEEDKGVYNITIDTTGLNVTDGISYFNYTLSLTFSSPNYKIIFQNLTLAVNPTPLYIDSSDISNVYEDNNITIQAALYENKSGELNPYSYINVEYSIYNSSGYVSGGTLLYDTSNIFRTSLEFSSINSLFPGDYWVIINASGVNVETTIGAPINFTIYAKDISSMTIIFPEKIRIGSYFDIGTLLTFINGTPITNADIQLKINYSIDYSFNVFVTTDTNGKATYELIIPQYYKENNITVFAQYSGTNYIKGTWANKTQEILDRIPVNITFIENPSYVQVGYNATFGVNMQIEGKTSDNRILFFFGFYDYHNISDEPFIIRELKTDENGTAYYTLDSIDDGYHNLTIFIEFLGDSAIQNQVINLTLEIRPKWTSVIVANPLPDEIHLGQTIVLNVSLNSTNATFSESFEGLLVTFRFKYDDFTQTFKYYLDENWSIYFTYNIPDSGVTMLNLSIIFSGTDKIQSYTKKLNLTILPKKTTQIKVISSISGQIFEGTYYYSINLTDQDGVPLANVNVTFNIYDLNGKLINSFSGVTNQYGYVSVGVSFDTPGNYIIKIEFDGHSIYSGTSSDEISVEIVTYWTLFLDKLPLIGLIALIIIIALFTFHRTVIIPRRIRRMEALRAIHQRLADVENIQYILILNKDGLSLFSRTFANIPIDETLVSGFLSAISSFGEEIGGKVKQKAGSEKGLEQLSYKQFKIIVDDVTLVRTAILLLKDASPSLKTKLHRFNLRFQEQYLDILENWTGKLPEEGPILELIENVFEVDLLYPHRINHAKIKEYMKSLDKKSIEYLILKEAQSETYNNVFYIRDMINHLTEMDKKEIIIFNAIDKLRKEGIIFAINPRTQYLIDQFKPVIDRLSEDAKVLLKKISQGFKSISKLRKSRDIKNFDQAQTLLMELNLIDSDNHLTEIGEAVVTLLALL
ncbi:MAG: hypothetical protein ACTSU2_17280 [Promethearchaeota archaeon]